MIKKVTLYFLLIYTLPVCAMGQKDKSVVAAEQEIRKEELDSTVSSITRDQVLSLLEKKDEESVKKLGKLIDLGLTKRREFSPSQLLMYAAHHGNLPMVQKCIIAGGNIHATDDKRTNSFMYTAMRGHKDIVQWLVGVGYKNFEKTNCRGETALMLAAAQQQFEMVDLLLKIGANIHAVDDHGVSALEWAAEKGHTEIVYKLVNAEKNPAAQRKMKESALVDAVKNDQNTLFYALVEMLKKEKDEQSSSVLAFNNAMEWAACRGNLAAVKKLVSVGADKNKELSQGGTYLPIAAGYGHNELVQYFIQEGLDVDARYDTGATALMVAVQNGHVEVVKTLINAKANLELGYLSNGSTPLMEAALNRRVEIVDLLIEAGADVEATDNNKRTALSFSVAMGDCTIVQKLIETVKDESLQLKLKESALCTALHRGHDQLVNMLITQIKSKSTLLAGEGLDKLMLSAVADGHVAVVKVLVEAGGDVKKKLPSNSSYLIEAAAGGYNELVQYLIQKGVDVNAQHDTGATALMLATQRGHAEVVKTLINAKANLEFGYLNNGSTPLMEAVAAKHADIVELLLKNGANVEAYDQNHKSSVWSWAIHNNNIKIMRNLLSYTKQSYLKFILNWACEQNNLMGVRVLLSKPDFKLEMREISPLLVKLSKTSKTQYDTIKSLFNTKLAQPEKLFSAIKKNDVQAVKKHLDSVSDLHFYDISADNLIWDNPLHTAINHYVRVEQELQNVRTALGRNKEDQNLIIRKHELDQQKKKIAEITVMIVQKDYELSKPSDPGVLDEPYDIDSNVSLRELLSTNDVFREICKHQAIEKLFQSPEEQEEIRRRNIEELRQEFAQEKTEKKKNTGESASKKKDRKNRQSVDSSPQDTTPAFVSATSTPSIESSSTSIVTTSTPTSTSSSMRLLSSSSAEVENVDSSPNTTPSLASAASIPNRDCSSTDHASTNTSTSPSSFLLSPYSAEVEESPVTPKDDTEDEDFEANLEDVAIGHRRKIELPGTNLYVGRHAAQRLLPKEVTAELQMLYPRRGIVDGGRDDITPEEVSRVLLETPVLQEHNNTWKYWTQKLCVITNIKKTKVVTLYRPSPTPSDSAPGSSRGATPVALSPTPMHFSRGNPQGTQKPTPLRPTVVLAAACQGEYKHIGSKK